MKINHEKIKNYNQLLLAIAGTAGLIFLIVAGIIMVVEFTSYYFDDDEIQTGIIAQEEADQLLKDSLRKQIISFRNISVLDSGNQVFIMPVSQANLGEEENIDELIGLTNVHRPYSKIFSKNAFYGHNNLVLYFSKEDTSIIVFDFKISISEYDKFDIDNRNFLLIQGASYDSNKDGYLNGNDFQEIYAYDLPARKLSKIDIGKNKTAIGYFRPLKSDKLFVKLGVERDMDNRFNHLNEPAIFYEIDIENMKLKEWMDEKQIESLQRLLDGKQF